MCNIEQRIMTDLNKFKNAQIKALQEEVSILRETKYQYATWILELIDKDTPDEYKDVIRNEVIKNY